MSVSVRRLSLQCYEMSPVFCTISLYNLYFSIPFHGLTIVLIAILRIVLIIVWSAPERSCAFPPHHTMTVLNSGIARSHSWGAKFRGSGGQKSPNGVQGQSPGGGLGGKPSEAEKHDINFALRTTFVYAYCPFYSLYIITFVIWFSRSSHISDFQFLP